MKKTLDLCTSDLVGAIYDCVANEQLWPKALAEIGRQVDGFLTTLAVFDTTTNSARLAQVACDDPSAISVLTQHAKEIPFFHLLQQIELDQPGPLERMFDLYGPGGEQVWKTGELYQNFHSRYGVLNSIDTAVLKRKNRIGTLNISIKYEGVGREQFDRIGLIAPHIRRAVTIHDMFEMERAESRVFRDLVGRLEHGVIIVADTMEVLYANSAAEQHLRDQSHIAVMAGRLSATFPRAQTALERAVWLGVSDEVSLGGSGIDIPLGFANRPALAHVLPLQRRAEQMRTEHRAAAAIFIAVAGTTVQTAIEAVGALFTLTPTEKRISSYVSEGLTRREIAHAQGVSEGTVKSQLAAIYDKTGTDDQRSLQSLIRELTAPVNRAN
ncbi:MAG: helix-turn-helix transcriptional regulator [Aestuariivirga sp.]